MHRVIVVGPAGSGKTTLAGAVGAACDLPHTELDALWWGPGWSEVGPEEFRRRLAPVVATDRWVLCGNYFSMGMRDLAWPRADTIVWVDLAKWRTIPRIVVRTIRRSRSGVELWPGTGNREHLRGALGRDELLRFAWRAHPKYRARYSVIREDPELAHLTVIRLGSPRVVREWLEEVDAVMSDPGLIVVTGPPGAGKSTVAAALAARLDPSVLVSGDAFFGFLVTGAVAPWLPESRAQNEVVTEASAAAAGRFAREYATVFDGMVGPWFLSTFARTTGVDRLHYVVLLPSLDRCRHRVATRVGHGFDDDAATEKMHGEFTRAEIDPRHLLVDPPEGVDTVADLIVGGVAEGRFRHTVAGSG